MDFNITVKFIIEFTLYSTKDYFLNQYILSSQQILNSLIIISLGWVTLFKFTVWSIIENSFNIALSSYKYKTSNEPNLNPVIFGFELSKNL